MKQFAGVLIFVVILASCSPSENSSPTSFSESQIVHPFPTITLKPQSVTLTHVLTPSPALTAIIISIETSRPTHLPLPTAIDDAQGVPMMFVPAGNFMMGNDGGHPDQSPAHLVYLDAFLIDRYETSNALYGICVDAGVCSPPHYQAAFYLFPDDPVTYVDWKQAKDYCEWRDAKLPTEAQWEKAARGLDERSYPWGEGVDCTKAAFKGCKDKPFTVGTFERGISPYGVYDMAGNVWEWVADWYSESYYQISPVSNPVGPTSGQYRVLRGGSWRDSEYYLYAYYRDKNEHVVDPNNIGFRCAKSANP